MYQKRAAVAARRPKNFRAPASENRTQYDHACTPNVEEVLPYTEKDSLVRPFGYAAVVPWVGGLTTITRGPSRRMRARRRKLRALVSVRVLAFDEEVVARDRAAGPFRGGAMDGCSTYGFSNVFAMAVGGPHTSADSAITAGCIAPADAVTRNGPRRDGDRSSATGGAPRGGERRPNGWSGFVGLCAKK